VNWSWTRFEDLGVHGLYDVLTLRCRVFILEQGAFLDTDGADPFSWHLRGHDEMETMVAYLRVCDPGIKYAEASLGRVVTAPEIRRSGQGRVLMREGLQRCARQWPGQAIRISAQVRLREFYSSFGFAAASGEYIEDGIPHLQMLWRPA
jgi:ElaA protein